MILALQYAFPFFVLFALACELRAPWRFIRQLDREFSKDLSKLFAYPKTEERPTYLDELWQNVRSR